MAVAACQADELRPATPAAEAAAAQAAGLVEAAALRAVADAMSGAQAWQGRAAVLEAELAAARSNLAQAQQARSPLCMQGVLPYALGSADALLSACACFEGLSAAPLWSSAGAML